jgi:hypothetical protein
MLKGFKTHRFVLHFAMKKKLMLAWKIVVVVGRLAF